MSLQINAVKQIFPNAFKGSYANINEKLLQKLEYCGQNLQNLTGIRNGIAVVKEPFKKNFGTTDVFNFYKLNDKNELVLLKNKAVYYVKQSKNGLTLRGNWSYNIPKGEMKAVTTTGISGNLLEKRIVKEKSKANNAENIFYWLPNSKMKLYEKYNFKNGTYTKLIKDTEGNLGVVGEFGRLKKENYVFTKEKIKDGSFAFNPNLGGTVNVRKPKDRHFVNDFLKVIDQIYDKNIIKNIKKFLKSA